MQQLIEPMCERALRHAGSNSLVEICAGARIFVSREKTMPTASLYEPMLCVVLSGAKEVTIGDKLLRYDPARFFIASMDLPVSGHIVKATAAEPYICLSLKLEPDMIAELIPSVPVTEEGLTTGFAVSPVTQQLLDPWSRMLELLDAPRDATVLAPMLKREILFRLLQGPQGGVMRQIARADSRLSQIREAVGWIRAHFDEPIRVEAMAELAGMSVASFHRHFKAATALSPLQYQKRLRLQEARRLIIANADSALTAYRVGYESASQFSREYARMFGAPPSRDAERLRGQRPDPQDTVGVL